MPFTLAHPAAATPFARYGLPLSALVVGSMAPDFPYFIPGFPDLHFGHTWAGLVLFDWPAGVLALWIFHNVLKLPLLSLFPTRHQAGLGPIATKFRFGPWRHFFVIVFALLLGALTHLAWDSITHDTGWTVRQVPLLRGNILRTEHGTITVFKTLQYSSSLLGMALLAFWYSRWLQVAPKRLITLPVQMPRRWKRPFLCAMLLPACLVASGLNYHDKPSYSGLGWMQLFARHFVVGGIQVLILEMLVFSVIWHIRASGRDVLQGDN